MVNLLDGTLSSARAGKMTKKKILLYITTHLSEMHYAYLERCWPALLESSTFFKQCDYMMFITATDDQKPNLSAIHSVFARPGIVIHSRPNPGYNEGAILALQEAFQNKWFDGYDWVVRLNPDVLIRNDSSLLEYMDNPRINGIFVDCFDRECPTGNKCVNRLIHTDFFAVRPRAILPEDVAKATNTQSEKMATELFSGIVKNGTDSWLPGTGPHHGNCRVEGKGSPIIHAHDFETIYPACLSWYG